MEVTEDDDLSCDSLDFPGSVLDEIALEGLDGLTIEGLWQRLAARKPAFAFIVDESTKNFLWDVVRALAPLEFYLLPEPRPPLHVFDRFAPKFVDPDTGLITDDEDRQDIYPFLIVDDGEIRGSCATYKTRKLLSVLDIRAMPLDLVARKYGNSLVMVANQRARNIALTGNHPVPVKLSAVQYAMIERIGRGRESGETTQGNLGLIKTMDLNAKSMFHVRKLLLKHELMCKQDFSVRSKKGINLGGRLLHLPRFYFRYLPKAERAIRAMADVLRTLPKWRMPQDELFERLGFTVQSMKKTVKSATFKKHLKFVVVPYRDFYPDALKSKYMTKGMTGERRIKLLEMISDPDELGNDDDEDDDEAPDGDDDDEAGVQRGFLDKSNFVPNRHLHDQAILFAETKGAEGASMSQFEQSLGLSKLDARCIVRKLHKRKDLVAVAVSRGRQKVNKYVSKYLDRSTLTEKDGELSMRTQELETLKAVVEKQKAAIASLECKGVLPVRSCHEWDSEESTVGLDSSSPHVMDVSSPALMDMSLPHIMELSQDVKRGGLLNIRIQKIVEDRLEVIVERDEAGGKKKHPVEDDNKKGLMSEDMTGLNMRRARQILEYLDSKKLVPLYFVHKWLKKREQDEGSAQTVDRKSLLNLLAKMEREGLIRCLKTTYEWLSQARQCTFVVHASFPTDPRSLETRLNAEEMSVDMSLLRGGDGEMSAVPVPDGLMEYWSVRGPQMGSKVKDNQQEDVKPNGEKSRGFARKSATVPKFQRSFLLHQLVFYITHAYEGDPSLDQAEAWAEINEKLSSQHGSEQVLSEEAIQQMPRLYTKEISWKMFLPPLLSHPSWLTTDGEPVPKGWLMLCEVIVRLPLSRAFQLINVKDPTFESDYFTHPVKKFVPVLRSEETVRLHLLQGRVFIQRMVDNMSILAAMGLVQIGKRLTSQSDTNFYYVNLHATIVDTRAAKECYNQISSTAGFERHSYQFTDMEALEEYWQHMQIISLDTKMGSLNAKDEESKNVVSLSKNSSMREVWVPVDFSDAPQKDVGKIPGNGKGAAGLDSSMFVHLMRSWFPSEGKEPTIQEPNILTAKADPRRLSVCPPEIQEHVAAALSEEPERRSTRPAPASREPEADEQPPAKKKKAAKKRGRQSTTAYDAPGMEEEDAMRKKSDPKKRKHGGKNSVVHYEDEMDRSIAQRSVSRRAKWTYEETTILTMCKAAIDLVTEDLRKTLADQSLNPIACRNILHDYVKDSDKTVPPIFRWFRSLRNKPKVAQMALIYASFLKRCAEARLIVEQLAPITTVEEGKEAVEQVLAPLVEILHREFILAADGDGVSSLDLPTDKLPPTLEEFWQQYVIDDFCNKRVESYKTPPVVSQSDIQMAAASTVLMTSLCSRADKKNWTLHLFKIYNDYTPSMLRKILHQFQHLRICARIKFKRRVNKRLSVMQLPLTASSYRLSARFNDKFRVSAFRYELFEEVGEALGAVLRFASKGRNYFDVTPFSHGGLASVMTALTSAGLANVTAELPDREIITYEKRSIDFPKKDVDEMSSIASSPKLPGSGDKALHRAGSQAYFSSRKENPVPALLSDVSFQSGSSSPSGSQCSSSMGPPGTPPLSISPTKSFKRSASKVACASHRRRLMAQAQMPMDPEDEEARISRNVKVHVSRLFFALGAPVEANQGSTGSVRNFEIFLPNPTRDEVLRLHHTYVRRESSDPRDLFEACRKEGVSEHDIRRMKEIFRTVKEEGVMGLTLPALKAKLISRDASRPPPPPPSDAISLRLGQLLRLLLRYQQLWLVGSHDLRFVVNEHVKPWMVETFKMTRLEQENAGTAMEQIKAKAGENNRRNKGQIGPGGDGDPAQMAVDVAASRDVETFTSRLVSDSRQFHTMLFPWTHVDGTLNRRVLDRMLGSVLAHLMDKPGQTVCMIADHFDPYLTPRHTYELLTILDRLACIRATVMSSAPQENTIFTPVDHGTWGDDDVTEDVEADNLIYEPAIDATIRLGAFVAQKEYSKPFLSLSETS